MTNTLNDNTVYYTIINKKKLKFKVTMILNERLETLQAKYVLSCMLKHFGIKEEPIYKSKSGKPYFKKQNIFFNYSHSNNYIACAISNYEVGIDIEETDRVINSVMIKICNFNQDTELEELVRREAYCKLSGNGIAMFFDKNNFKDIDASGITISNDEYICSIFSDCFNPSFQSIDI